jgi:hypothetical protein
MAAAASDATMLGELTIVQQASHIDTFLIDCRACAGEDSLPREPAQFLDLTTCAPVTDAAADSPSYRRIGTRPVSGLCRP